MKKLSLFVIAFLHLAGAPLSAEKPPIKPPVEFSLHLVGNDSTPACGIITVLDNKGAPVLPGGEARVNGSIKLPLPKGTYSFLATGGARIMPVTKVLEISPEKATATLTLADYAPVWQAGWKLCCTFFNPALTNVLPSGSMPYEQVEDLRVSSRSRGIELLGCAGLLNLKNSANTAYIVSPSGGDELSTALAAAADEGVAILSAWSVQRPGAGNILALEPNAQSAPELSVPDATLFPALAALRDRGGISAFCVPTGLPGGTSIAEEICFTTVAGPLFDLMDISRGGADLRLWWTLLNQGYRIPACGGGAQSILPSPTLPPLGMYLLLPRKKPTAELFLQALKNGNGIVSNGPFLRFFVQRPEVATDNVKVKPRPGDDISGQVCGIGASTPPSALQRKVWLDAYSCSDPADSIRRIELIYNGEVIQHHNISQPGQKTTNINWNNIVLDRSGWLLARYYSYAGNLWAVTNPIYVSNSATPSPTSANCSVRVTAADTNRPLGAKVEALNFNTVIGHWETGMGELKLKLPATAELRITADGYEPATIGVYAEGGAKAYMEQLRKEDRLPAALLEKATYEQMRRKLENSKISVTLHRISARTRRP